ncbi:MAG: DUF1559 domain-containing protein [Planctomycetes bacterium]|nr:DUF1559 domain-containing protein [Planctomycetota bacterium]
MTLIELLIAITIVGILASLLLMSVQAARESGRRGQCASHIRQVGLAIAAYESTYRVFPPGLSEHGGFHVAILPFLEQDQLHDQLITRFQAGNYGPFAELPRIPVLQCPSDGAIAMEGGGAGTNYAGNCGVWGHDSDWDGVLVYWVHYSNTDEVGPVRLADVLDGLSNTCAVTEILRANGTPDRLRVNWNTPQTFKDIDAFAERCRTVPPHPEQYGWKGNRFARGVPWTDGNVGYTLYDHVLRPNQPSCYNGSGVGDAASTAASQHKGGANVLFADWRVEFYSDDVDLRVWRSLASRAGGEAK